MAKRKNKDDVEKDITVDNDLVTDEEQAALEAEYEEGGDEETKDKKGDDEGGEKTGDEEGEVGDEAKGKKARKSKDEGGKKKRDEGDAEDGEEEATESGARKSKERVEGEGEEEGPAEGAAPVTLTIDGEKVEGFIAKSGKYIIPYSEVAKRDEARRTLKATSEVQKHEIEQLKGQVTQLTERLKSDRGHISSEGEKAADQLDFKAMGKKLYQSEDDAAEVLEAVFNAGRKAERAGAGETSPEGQQQDQTFAAMTTEQKEAQIKAKVAFETEVERLMEEHPELRDEKVEFLCYQMGMKLMGDKLRGMEPEVQAAWVRDPENLLGIVREATSQTLGMIKPAEPSDEEKATREREMRERILEDLAPKLNLKPAEIRTLGDVSPASENEGDLHKELDAMDAAQLEEAIEGMTPEEREAYSKLE